MGTEKDKNSNWRPGDYLCPNCRTTGDEAFRATQGTCPKCKKTTCGVCRKGGFSGDLRRNAPNDALCGKCADGEPSSSPLSWRYICPPGCLDHVECRAYAQAEEREGHPSDCQCYPCLFIRAHARPKPAKPADPPSARVHPPFCSCVDCMRAAIFGGDTK